MMLKTYVAFDLETTGLNVETDNIIEIGALKVRNGKVTERFMEFLKPDTSIPPKITRITGITNAMTASARDTRSVIHDFIDFCGNDVLIGHNILFDYKFTKKYASQYGFSFEKEGIDTLKIARKLHKDLESKSLESLCTYYQIIHTSAHRAYYDALATAKLFHMLAHDFEAHNAKLFQPEQLQYKPKKIQPITPKQKDYLNALLHYHDIRPEQKVETLTRSEASKMIDNILFRYGKII